MRAFTKREKETLNNPSRLLGGLEVRRLPQDRRRAGSILTSGGGVKKNNRIRKLS
jgi:hypothetical protein